MEKQQRKKNSRLIIAGLVIISIIAGFVIYVINLNTPEKLNWDLIVLSEEIPQIQSDTAQLIENTEEILEIKIIGISEDDLQNYINLCKESHFEMEELEENGFFGVNKLSATIEITYFPNNEEMLILYTSHKKAEWEQLKLGQYLPKIESEHISINDFDDELELSIVIYEATYEQYDNYIQECIEYGYTINTQNEEYYFSAYNEEGYSITVSYDNYDPNYDATLSIYLSAPIEIEEIPWPESDVSKFLPVPKSMEGNIISSADDHMTIHIGKTTRSNYDSYVEACIDKGFNVNSENPPGSYSAENDEGYYLTLQYDEKNSIMTINILHPDNIETTYY